MKRDFWDRGYDIEPSKKEWNTEAGTKGKVIPKFKRPIIPASHDFLTKIRFSGEKGRNVFNKAKTEIIIIK